VKTKQKKKKQKKKFEKKKKKKKKKLSVDKPYTTLPHLIPIDEI